MITSGFSLLPEYGNLFPLPTGRVCNYEGLLKMKRLNQNSHDSMVRNAVNYLRTNGFNNIKADIGGYDCPTKITWMSTGKGHIPDIDAHGDKKNIFEIETEDSISDPHTADQWKLFSKYADEHGADFWVVVPKGSEYSASFRLAELGIKGKIWGLNN